MIAIANPLLFWILLVVGILTIIILMAWAGGLFEYGFGEVLKLTLIIFGIFVVFIIFIGALSWSICGSWGVCK